MSINEKIKLLQCFSFPILMILTGSKNHRQIKLQRLQNLRIWAFGLLVHQINSLSEVLKLKQKAVTAHWLLIWQFCTEMMRFQS